MEFDPRQVRGDRSAYERYLAGMDASMRQKVALTAAYLLCEGRVADMGMGSGAGSHALAALYPSLSVVGVDMDPSMVRLAQEKYALPNLTFVVGDVAQEVFAEGSLDGILDSSVLHHVTSFGGYVYENAARCIATQARALRPHGTIVVLDFVAPHEGEVFLDLPADDGDGGDDPRTCSTSALLERFAREFRSLSREPGFSLVPSTEAPRPGWKRYALPHRIAVEFALRKDYREHWESEVKEEYTYFTQAEFERAFASVGMRVLASTPLQNPWIVRNRFEDKLAILSMDGRPLPWPSTNYFIVGEKVRPGEGVRFREGARAEALGFLQMTHYRDRRTGRVRDLVRRPHVTLDVVPYFVANGEAYVLARMSYPRPILASETRTLDGDSPAHYVTEPLNVLLGDRSMGETVEAMLSERACIPSSGIRGFHEAATYYPSPGGTQEEVRSVLVEIEPLMAQENLPNASGFSTSGRLRAIAAEQVLRAAQVGALPDARLELCVYDLLAELGRGPGPWIGDRVTLAEARTLPPPTNLASLARRPRRRAFELCDPAPSEGFLSLRSVHFEELDSTGQIVRAEVLEYVLPARLSLNTVACAPLALREGVTYLGVDDDDLPAAQCFLGNSQLLVAPAWRIPRDVPDDTAAVAFTLERLRQEYGVVTGRTFPLGGRYHPSAGMSPEVVHPIAVEVLGDGGKRLCWIPLSTVASQRKELLDGHLRVVALRAAHALGLVH